MGFNTFDRLPQAPKYAKQYRIETNISTDYLEKDINELCRDGWSLQKFNVLELSRGGYLYIAVLKRKIIIK